MVADELENTPTSRPPAPYSTYQAVTRSCPECGRDFETKSRTKLFCSNAHKLTFHNRCAARGKVIIPLAMAWRGGRGAGDTAKRAFMKMNSKLDEWNAEDRQAKRMPMIEFVEKGFANFQRF